MSTVGISLNSKRSTRRWRRLFWLAVLAGTAGCGSDLSSLSGKITVGGNPPPPEAIGRITFQPVGEGPTVMGQINPDGTYIAQTGSTKGIPPGKYRVNVYGTIGIPAMGGGGRIKMWHPERYANYDTSGLEVEIGPGRNEKNFDLSPK